MATKQRRVAPPQPPDPTPVHVGGFPFALDGKQDVHETKTTEPVPMVLLSPDEIRNRNIRKTVERISLFDQKIAGRRVFIYPCGMDKGLHDYMSRSVSGRWYRICGVDVRAGDASIDPETGHGWREINDASVCRILDAASVQILGVVMSTDEDEENTTEDDNITRRRRRSTPDADDAAAAKPTRKKRKDGLRPGGLPALICDVLKKHGEPMTIAAIVATLNNPEHTPRKVMMAAVNTHRRGTLRFEPFTECIGLPSMSETSGWTGSKRKARGEEKRAAKAEARRARADAKLAAKDAKKKRRRKSASGALTEGVKRACALVDKDPEQQTAFPNLAKALTTAPVPRVKKQRRV